MYVPRARSIQCCSTVAMRRPATRWWNLRTDSLASLSGPFFLHFPLGAGLPLKKERWWEGGRGRRGGWAAERADNESPTRQPPPPSLPPSSTVGSRLQKSIARRWREKCAQVGRLTLLRGRSNLECRVSGCFPDFFLLVPEKGTERSFRRHCFVYELKHVTPWVYFNWDCASYDWFNGVTLTLVSVDIIDVYSPQEFRVFRIPCFRSFVFSFKTFCESCFAIYTSLFKA